MQDGSGISGVPLQRSCYGRNFTEFKNELEEGGLERELVKAQDFL